MSCCDAHDAFCKSIVCSTHNSIPENNVAVHSLKGYMQQPFITSARYPAPPNTVNGKALISLIHAMSHSGSEDNEHTSTIAQVQLPNVSLRIKLDVNTDSSIGRWWKRRLKQQQLQGKSTARRHVHKQIRLHHSLSVCVPPDAAINLSAI
eukprot:1138933-Pelagomonas_calceolata.AAC.2